MGTQIKMSTINRYFTVREGTPVADDGTSDSPTLRHSVFRPGDRVCKVVISSDVYHRLLDQFKDETYENVGA